MESFGLRKSAPRKPEAPVHPPAANDEDHMEFVHIACHFKKFTEH